LVPLEVGQVVQGRVGKILDFGVLVDVGWIGKRMGLVHISKLPRVASPVSSARPHAPDKDTGWVEHPSQVVQVGQQVNVRVTEVDKKHARLGLSMRPIGGRSSKDVEVTEEAKASLTAGTSCVGILKAVREGVAFIDVGCGLDGALVLPSPLLSPPVHCTQDPSRPSDYLWWDITSPLRALVGRKVHVVVDRWQLPQASPGGKGGREDKANGRGKGRLRLWLRLPTSMVLSGTCSRPLRKPLRVDSSLQLHPSLSGLVSNTDTMNIVLAYLDRSDLHRMSPVLTLEQRARSPLMARLRTLAADMEATTFIHEELVCFHSRKHYSNGLLGLGLSLQHYSNNGDLCGIVPCLDFVCREAYEVEKIRRGVWQVPFTHWLPLYISAQHAGDLKAHEEAIALICTNKYLPHTHLLFHPAMVLKVLPALLNTMIVEMMKGSLFESELALQGYLTFYHLFLALVLKYPELQREIDRRVESFLGSEEGRKKRECPNLGEFLACLACSSYSWKQVAVAVLTEVFDRNVKWVILSHPELVNMRELQKLQDAQEQPPPPPPPPTPPPIAAAPSAGLSSSARRRLRHKKMEAWAALTTPVPGKQEGSARNKTHKKGITEKDVSGAKLDRGRLPKTWKATGVSCRLVMFHVLFLRMFRLKPADQNLRRDEGTGDQGQADEDEDREVEVVSVAKTKAMLDRTYGRATHVMTRRFQTGVKIILRVPDWAQFFRRCLLPVPEPFFLCRWLQRSALNSARKRYHSPDAVKEALEAARFARRQASLEKKRLANPLALFDEEEKAALGEGFCDYEAYDM
jgi:predicted RNA-binding protein with RPS1 domain